MNKTPRTVLALLVGFTATALVAGCVDYVAEYYTPLTDPKLATWDDGGDSGGGGGTPIGCDPSKAADPVADSCGVFVSSSAGSDAGGKGTKAAPYATLTKALAAAKGKPVYACGEVFSAEAVSIAQSATLYGALDCSNGWAYDATKKTQLAPKAEGIALTIGGATTSAEVADFAITSESATQAGGSSIAVLVTQGAASFTRCDLVAGDGAPGSVGAPYPTSAQAGSMGLPGTDACAAAASLGGLPVTNACGNPDSVSGIGGTGQAAKGSDGDSGSPGTLANGGIGDTGAGCGAGTKGDDGDTMGLATPGNGATGTGTLSASGYAAPSSGNGGPGKPGQGGGGGGGAKGGSGAGMCMAAGSAGGASGGSGGSGGCGGLGGNGGSAGGSSIALVSIDATLSLAGVTLDPGAGGKGGDGGVGQSGGSGADGGPGGGAPASATSLKPACPGGKGGSGGTGARGGGGLGGHSIGLAFTGKAPPSGGWAAKPGSKGLGGTGDDTGGNPGDGSSGLACKSLDFADATSCAM
jgi:hypothetical protein